MSARSLNRGSVCAWRGALVVGTVPSQRGIDITDMCAFISEQDSFGCMALAAARHGLSGGRKKLRASDAVFTTCALLHTQSWHWNDTVCY